jgi:hypothetical protein
MAKAKERVRKPTEGFVLDNSIVMAWSFEDEVDEYADAVLERLAETKALVPVLWPLEVANALLMGERRKRSTEADTIKWTPCPVWRHAGIREALHRSGHHQVDRHPGIAAHRHRRRDQFSRLERHAEPGART